MPPKKSRLAAMKKQIVAHRKTTASSLAHSAYGELTRVNRGQPACDEDEVEGPKLSVVPSRKKAKKAKASKPKPKPAEMPTQVPTEHWRPAGGENYYGQCTNKNEITPTLGIARISTWRLDDFTTSLLKLIADHEEIEEFRTKKFVQGFESHTDVVVRFRSELAAELVKEKIDGELVNGRRLQVDYA